MHTWLPIVNEQVAQFLERLGWLEGRDFLISPSLPDDANDGCA